MFHAGVLRQNLTILASAPPSFVFSPLDGWLAKSGLRFGWLANALFETQRKGGAERASENGLSLLLSLLLCISAFQTSPLGRSLSSVQDFLHYRAIHIGESVVAADVAPSQSRVIEAQQMQHGGVQIVNVDFAVDHFKTHVVGLAVSITGLDSTPAIQAQKLCG